MGKGSRLAQVRRDPGLLVSFGRSALRHRVMNPLMSHRRPGGLAVFHTGRCGSTVLSNLLEQHPDIYWDGETYGRVISDVKSRGLSRADVVFDPVDYLTGRLKRSGKQWFGYDLKFSHVTEFGMTVQEYLDGIDRLGIHKVVGLRRRNYLRQVISARNGSRRGQFHLRAADQRESLPLLTLDPEGLAVDLYSGSLLDHFERWDHLYDELRQRVGERGLWLEYESHIEQDPVDAYRLVVDHLGLEPFEPTVRLQRSNPEPIEALLGNHAEIREYLRGTRYEWMTEDEAG